MKDELAHAAKWLFAPETECVSPFASGTAFRTGMWSAAKAPDFSEPKIVSTHLAPRWLFLRALGLIYFSAFYSLLFQIRGLIGPNGILPAATYLQAVSTAMHGARFWFTPTLLWFSSSDRALMIITVGGLVASLLVVFNILPRVSLAVCFVCFISFVSSARDFAGYQSDGMLLEAGLIAVFFAPWGFRPGVAVTDAPSRASLYLLRWEWFRIHFESGVVKIASGDKSWRNLTAMDDYYQNGPLPTWIGWYVQKLPHAFHAFTVVLTFAIELGLVWMLFLPRRFRIICFWIVTFFQVGIVLTANYTFINYLLLSLGILLLDDEYIATLAPKRIREKIIVLCCPTPKAGISGTESWHARLAARTRPLRTSVAAFCITMLFYCTATQVVLMVVPGLPFPDRPVRFLEPFRVADSYGLFATMTHARYEIEFQGSRDGKAWTAYPFRYKPQDVNAAPGIYAPYQPRFDWNLWFASLAGGPWQNYRFVLWTEERLLHNQPEVLQLFARNPFPGDPPLQVRSQIYQYWFTDIKTKRATGAWWNRELLGEYAPALEREPDGKIFMLDAPVLPPLPE